MAIICWPEGVEHGDKVLCALCNRYVAFSEASAGPHRKDGQLAFACEEHYYYPSLLLAGWADVTTTAQVAPTQFERVRT